MDGDRTANRWAFQISVVLLLMLLIVVVAFREQIAQGRVKKMVVGPVIIEIDTAKIPEAGGGIASSLQAMESDEKLFLLGRERGEFDAVCTDSESTDPQANPRRKTEQQKEAAAWKQLERLQLADARPARDPYLWCKPGATQTYALTELGLAVKSYLETVLLQALSFREARR